MSRRKDKPYTAQGAVIKEAREAKNLTRTELAVKCKVGEQSVRQWEWGNTTPTYPKIVAEILGVDANLIIK